MKPFEFYKICYKVGMPFGIAGLIGFASFSDKQALSTFNDIGEGYLIAQGSTATAEYINIATLDIHNPSYYNKSADLSLKNCKSFTSFG